jgi:hypothetical protein
MYNPKIGSRLHATLHTVSLEQINVVPSDLSQIASYANAVEAEQMRAILEEHGVAAYVEGATVNTALSFIGNTLGGVKLLVPKSDAEKAVAIIHTLGGASETPGGDWFCGECEETVDAGFEVCWSCGQSRADVQRPFPATVAGQPTEPVGEPHHHVEIEPDDITEEDRLNPYASPRDNTPPPKISADEDIRINPEAEAMLLRAWRASVIGLVMCPLIIHMYSMYLLIRASMLTSTFSPAGTRRFYLALLINVFLGCAVGVFFLTRG